MRFAFLGVLALLPLQWIAFGGLRLYQVAIALFILFALASCPPRAFAPVLGLTYPFLIAAGGLIAVDVTTALYNGGDVVRVAKEFAYLAGFLAVATVLYRGLRQPEQRLLQTARWANLAALVVLVAACAVSVAVNRVDLGVVGRAMGSANPALMSAQFFEPMFTGFGLSAEEVRSNVRHSVFEALLVSMYVSAAAAILQPIQARSARTLHTLTLVASAGLLLLSLSRSVIIAALVWPALLLAKTVMSARITARFLVTGLAVVTAGFAIASSGFVHLVRTRFVEDTSSYEGRRDLLDTAFSDISRHALTGGVESTGGSAHNFVLDAWLRSGVVAALLAAIAVIVLLGLLVSLAANLDHEPRWMVPVAALLALPLVRMFTAGGGLITPPSWVALGVVAGFMTYRGFLRRRRPPAALAPKTASVAPG